MPHKFLNHPTPFDQTQHNAVVLLPRPCAACSFARRFLNWISRRIAEREQNLSGALWLLAIQFAHRLAKGRETKVSLAACVIDSVEKCSEIDELRSCVHKVK